jgi:putative heme transporter
VTSGPPSRPRARQARTGSPARGQSRPTGALAGSRTQPRPPEPHARPEAGIHVSAGLRTAAAYSWRILVVGVVLYVGYMIVLRLELLGIAMFLALVFTSVARPPVNAMSRYLPRWVAVLITMLGGLLMIAALFTAVGTAVAGESGRLGSEFHGGLNRIEVWLQGPPIRISHSAVTGLQGKFTAFISAHRSTLLSRALSGASQAVEVLTVLALSVFCTIFFTYSGEHMWQWFTAQMPSSARTTWDRAASAAWRTFSGYTRGVIIVAGTNALMVGIALYFLGVPLALPLTVLEFFFSFIPLVGSPIAMAVATVVALASRGVVTALIVLVLIVVVGQIEGHLMQPLVMGWAVRLHPVAVALSVIGGTIIAGFVGAIVAVPVVSIAWAITRVLRASSSEAPLEPE